MARHILYTGSDPVLKGRRGFVVEVNKFSGTLRAVLNYPFDVPTNVGILLSDEIADYEPILPYPPVHARERSRYPGKLWNVTEAWRLITEDREAIRMDQQMVGRWYDTFLASGKVTVDHDRAMSAEIDPNIPILLVQSKVGDLTVPMLIDGWHRLYKAFHRSEQLMAYVLSPWEDHYLRMI